MGAIVTTEMADGSGHTRIPIVGLQIVVDRYVEYLREDLASSRKAAEWVERNIIRPSAAIQVAGQHTSMWWQKAP
jgi:hypothetical protein